MKAIRVIFVLLAEEADGMGVNRSVDLIELLAYETEADAGAVTVKLVEDTLDEFR